MVKQNKEESYTSKAKSLVKYPKFKKKEDEKEDDAGEKSIAKNDRPQTYKVANTNIQRTDIVEMIRTSPLLEDKELATQLFNLVDDFLRKNSTEE